MIVFSDDRERLSLARVPLELPPLRQYRWSPNSVAEAGQLCAYCLAVHKGLSPDQPRGLRKVMLTY